MRIAIACATPSQVGTSAISAVHCVSARTKTRSKNSSSGVTRSTSPRRTAVRWGARGGGELVLAGPQDVEPEALALPYQGERARRVVEADENEQRLQRQRRERVGREPARAVGCHRRDHGDPRGEVAEDGAEALLALGLGV